MDFELEYDYGCDKDKLKIKGKWDIFFICNLYLLNIIMVVLIVIV